MFFMCGYTMFVSTNVVESQEALIRVGWMQYQTPQYGGVRALLCNYCIGQHGHK